MNQAIAESTDAVSMAKKTFPAAGTNLARINSDPQYRQNFHKNLKRWNPMMVALYKSGLLSLFGVTRTMMLLTTRGRKSGKLRSTPIGYFRIHGEIHLFSAWGRSTGWYQNLKACPEEVWIRIGRQERRVQAQELVEPAEILGTLAQFVSESPDAAKYLFGWDPDRDRMEEADFSTVVEKVLIVRFSDYPGGTRPRKREYVKNP